MGAIALWKCADVLLDRSPFCLLARPLAGLVIGAVGGGVYGALCGGLHALLQGMPGLFPAWFLVAAGAGAVTGFLMGVCSAVDRARWGTVAPHRPPDHPEAEPPTLDEVRAPAISTRPRPARMTYPFSRN
jgi:hypothetical protein